ncbi:MAG: esterase-like activity of phytase family protein [Ferruginibacter sp.]
MVVLKKLFLFFALCSIVSCSSTKKAVLVPAAPCITGIKFLGQYIIPYNFIYKNTTVGGLSGIDYDAANNQYYLVSDDRSSINPARFYTAQISFTQKGIDTIQFTSVQNMLQPGGNVYPNNKQEPYHTPDPEDIRYNAVTKQLVWSSEGERIVKIKETILENPALTIVTITGKYIDTFALPENILMQATENGPRQNGVLEGLCFADNYKTLYVNVEEPLYEDGPRAQVTDDNAFIRIFKFDVAGRQNTKQFAYKLDPVAYPANPVNDFKINGIPDILSIGNNKLLVVERSFSSGRLACTIKVFIADLNMASDIKNISSLKTNSSFVPASKKLLLNMDNLGIYIDNIEGVTFGPVLPNGHKTLLFVADNNFNVLEKSQFLLFEVIE